MYYIINPLTWPFTIIPNLPQNLIEVIDSPIPLLIGLLGNKKLAEEINKIREGNNNIIIINGNKMKYFKEEKISFSKEPFDNLLYCLKNNFSELKIHINNKNSENYTLTCEKIYKNIYGSIQNEICNKIEYISNKHKNLLKKSSYGKSIDTLKTEELELRVKIRNEFIETYSNKNKNSESDFYKIFSQTQIFASYLDSYIEKINKK